MREIAKVAATRRGGTAGGPSLLGAYPFYGLIRRGTR